MPIIGPANVQDVGYKFINTPEQFPGYGTGLILLEDDTIYDLKFNTITITDSIRFPTDKISKIQNGIIVYAGSGTLFDTPVMGSLVKVLNELILSFTNGGTAFDLDCTGSTAGISMRNVAILNPGSLGAVDNCSVTIKSVRMTGIGTGLSLADNQFVSLTQVLISGTNQSTTFLDFNGTTQGQIAITGYSPELQGNEYAFNFDPSTTFTSCGVNGCIPTLSGTATESNIFESGSFDQAKIGFKFSGNVYIPDSTVSARIGFQDNATETVIDEEEVPVIINGTYSDGFEERTSYTSSGIITHTGLETERVSVRAYISLEPVTGVNILMGGYIGRREAATYAVTFTNGTNTVNRTAHGLSNGDSIMFSTTDTLPAEIRDDQFYFVVNKTDNTFQVSRTSGGGVYAFTDDGTGTHYYSLGEFINESEVTVAPSINEPDNMSIESFVSWAPGDKAFAMVDNHDSTSNILVTNINLLLNKV